MSTILAVTAQVDPWILRVLAACQPPLKNIEPQEVAWIKHRVTFQQNYLERLLEEKWLERTIPERPNIASTEGNQSVPGHEEIKIGLNVYTK